jgi:GntR family transcriptional regulator of gluconate operon
VDVEAQAKLGFDRVRQPSLVERVAADLRDAILSGQLGPGDRVSDARVADEMGISRAPVREAIRQLAARGLVQEEPRRGAFVVHLTRSAAHEIYECRRALEGLAARRLACDPELGPHIEALRSVVAEMERAATRRSALAMADADHRFHVALCERTGNLWLANLYGQIADQSRLMQTLDVRAHLDSHDHDLVYRHAPIVDAIATGDPDAAESAVLAHIDLSERLFLSEVPAVVDAD